MSTVPQCPASPAPGSDSHAAWLVFLALWLTLLIDSAATAPVPAVNEPHYLGKAKHFWDPTWCAGDLLLESSNAHVVFYFVMGYWAHWLSLPQLAWAGRIIGYGLLAWGWLRTHEVLGLARWKSWWSLFGFLALASWGNLSGEWLVGGIEGKVFSYAFLLISFADWQLGAIYRAAFWAGLAISFHPLAGGWAVLAAGLASVNSLRNRQRSWGLILSGWTIVTIAALPGLIPALQLIFTTDPPQVHVDATYLQVYYRLSHHLDPMKFSWRSWAGYGVMLVALLAMRKSWRASPVDRLWLKILCCAGVFAVAGMAAGWGPRPAAQMPYYLQRMQLLKYYPFRLFDVLLPLMISMSVTRLLSEWSASRPPKVRKRLAVATGVLLLSGLIGGQVFRQSLQSASVFETPEWIAVCDWVRDHTPADALVQSPTNNPNFKWYAQRAEYVSIKDIPQDSASIVEWNRRLLFLGKWYHDHHADEIYDNQELHALRRETGISQILTDRLGPFELAPCYTNGRFRVYDLTKLDNVE